MGDRTSTIEHFIEIHCTSMYICLLPQNHLFSQQVAIITMQLDHIAVHTPSLIKIEKGLEWEPGPRTSNNTFIIETHCTSMYICLLPQNQPLCQQVAIITMPLDHIAVHTPSLIKIERVKDGS